MHVITGGAGFLGSALLWQLNRAGIDEIIIVDNLGNSEKWRNLVKARYADYIHRDLFLELAKADKLPFTIDSIIHLGACSSTTEMDSDFLMENNFHYSQIICRYALDHGARFISASSAATYGAGENGFSDSETLIPLLRPLNMYGYSKHLFDLWLLRENLQSRVASLKFFNVYGPNEYHKGSMASVASKIYTEIDKTGLATLFASNSPDYSDGGQMRDFVYVKDCAALMKWLLLDAPQINGIRNVGSGQAASFNELAGAVFSAMGRPVNIRFREMPPQISANYQNYTCADMSWLRQTDCPVKFTDIETGIADYVCNYLAKADRYL